MAITRRTAKFATIAAQIDQVLADRGLAVPPGAVDSALNEKINGAAQLMGVGPKQALWYLPDDTAEGIAAVLDELGPRGEG